MPAFDRPAPLSVVLFLATWLAVGFASGTLTLLGPVRWVTTAMRDSGASASIERVAVMGIIAAYVALSFVLSLWLTRSALQRGGWVRYAAPVLAWVAAAACLWLWMTPQLVNWFQPVQVDSVARFTFGPYPERERFEQLKEDGYTAVISLLHPAVVPFEPSLLARERELAAEFEIELIHAPMLPWLGDNAATLAQLKELASRTTGRFYVHCYLGRDRVGVVRALVERVSSAAVADMRTHVPYDFTFDRDSFERGPIIEVDDAVFLTPYPTDEEMFAFVLGGQFASVVSLLDPENPDDVQWIEKERTALADHHVPFSLQPVPWMRYSPQAARAAAEHVRGLPRPVLVHAFRSGGTAAEAFLTAYKTGLAPVSPASFEEQMAGGLARVLAPNVVVGPRPAGPEFGSFLRARGVRSIVYVGDATREEAKKDRIVAEREAGLAFHIVPADAARLAALVAIDGPWYIYGPELGQVQSQLDAHFGASRVVAQPVAAAAAGQ
jgi:hypothetical protein